MFASALVIILTLLPAYLCLDKAAQPPMSYGERHLEVPHANITEPWSAYLGQQSLLPPGSWALLETSGMC